jgi:hypothetical protein
MIKSKLDRSNYMSLPEVGSRDTHGPSVPRRCNARELSIPTPQLAAASDLQNKLLLLLLLLLLVVAIRTKAGAWPLIGRPAHTGLIGGCCCV